MDRKAVFGIMVTLLLFMTLMSMQRSFCDGDSPAHIHLSWRCSDMSTTMTVTWQTIYSNSGEIVAFDNVSRSGNRSLYRYSSAGVTHTYAGASGYIHDVELTGLEPSSTYYFVCGGENGGYSFERSFRTAASSPSHLRFVAGGDCRSNPAQRDLISRAMSELDPDFVLFCGDFVASGGDQAEWDSFFESLDSYWVGDNGLTIPVVPCLGNHENNATNYYEQFALPNNEQWYSLDWGNYVHIIVLNSEADPTGVQLDWLNNDLESHKNFEWKFVLFHQPPYSSSSHGSWIQGQESWCPLFDKYHANIVFSGHDHDYERSKPVNYTASKTSPQDSYSNGTMYVVTGGWGAPLYASGSNWWTDYSSSVYHFVLVDVFTNGTLNLQAMDASGSTFDEETIQQTPTQPDLEFAVVAAHPQPFQYCDTFEVEIWVTHISANLKDYDFTILYDSSHLRFVDVDYWGVLGGSSDNAHVELLAAGRIHVWDTGGLIFNSGDGLLFGLTFHVEFNDDITHIWRKNSPHTITAEVSFENAQLSFIEGEIPMSGIAMPPTLVITINLIRGDVNCDGKVNIDDLSTVAMYCNELVPPGPEKYDLTQDGIIDIYDIVTAATNYGYGMP